MDRDTLAVEVSKILFKLYTLLDEEGKSKIYFNPSIKDKSIIKNCTPSTVEDFEEIVNERDSIIKFDLSISWVNGDDIEEEYNDKNKINVIISNDNEVILKYQYEIPEEKFNDTYAEIKKFLKENTDKKIIEQSIKRKKPLREMCDFGILGLYQLNRINIDTDKEYSVTQEKSLIKKILKKITDNQDFFNKKIFVEIYNQCLWGTQGMEIICGIKGREIWTFNFFKDIIHTEKLPANFLSLSDSEKSNILFTDNEIQIEDFDNIENTKLDFFNYEKIKQFNKLYNVVIQPEYKTISFELNFLCENDIAYCYPLIELNYNNFEIVDFDTGF